MERRREGYMVLHADLFVRSMELALEFYCRKLGFSVVDDLIVRGPLVENLSSGLYDEIRLVLLRVSPVGAMIELQEFRPDSALTADAVGSPLQIGLVSILVS